MTPQDTKLHAASFALKAFDEEGRWADFVASTSALDRDNEIVDQATWQLDEFRKNPVVLWLHNKFSMPIGKALSVSIDIENGAPALVVRIQFATADINEDAERIWLAVKAKFLNAVSAGFLPGRAVYEEVNGKRIRRLFDCKLYEISVVPIGANPEALAKAMGRFAPPEPAPSVGDKEEPTMEELEITKKALSESKGFESAITKSLGVDSFAAAIGAIDALKQKAAKHDEAVAKVAEIEAIEAKRVHEALVEKGRTDGKLTPAQEEWAKSLPTEHLKGYLAHAPVVLPRGGVTEPTTSVENAEVAKAIAGAKSFRELSVTELIRIEQADPAFYNSLRAAAGITD